MFSISVDFEKDILALILRLLAGFFGSWLLASLLGQNQPHLFEKQQSQFPRKPLLSKLFHSPATENSPENTKPRKSQDLLAEDDIRAHFSNLDDSTLSFQPDFMGFSSSLGPNPPKGPRPPPPRPYPAPPPPKPGPGPKWRANSVDGVSAGPSSPVYDEDDVDVIVESIARRFVATLFEENAGIAQMVREGKSTKRRGE